MLVFTSCLRRNLMSKVINHEKIFVDNLWLTTSRASDSKRCHSVCPLRPSSKLLCRNGTQVNQILASCPARYNATKLSSDEKPSRLKERREQVKDAKLKVKAKLDEMRENIVTVPNGLCLARIASTPVLGYFVVSNQFGLALSLFAFAGLTDLLDGYIARKFPGQQSVFGSFLDPFADKFLVATLFATLTYVNLIPVALTALIIARDVVLVFSGCVIRYKSLPPPKTVSRFFDVTMATAQLSPTLISKINTGVQLAMVSAALGAPVFDYTSSPALQWLFYITATTTVMSAMSYIFSRGTYKFIRLKRSK